jgi:MFS transporter, MHS family, shikimate and dehydroshikimate transport protein
MASTNSTVAAPAHNSVRLVAFASFIGTTIEWYDFFLYGTFAALVFNQLFFPTFDPVAGTLASFATYSIGFVARPVGGIVIGHFGDKVGRKSMLVLTLVVMGVATFLIGLLPTYEAIGWWAPLLLVLLRMAQGFGVGGEWGGAVLMAVEHAPAGKRGFYGSWPQVGVPAGLILANAVFLLVSSQLSDDQFLAWGWRVPFLISILLVVVGMVIRVRILETPAFEKAREETGQVRQPLIEVLKRHPKEVLLAMGARFAENGAFYIYSAFVLVYGTQHVKMDRSVVLNAILLGSALELVAIPFFGALSDRLGRRPVYLFGAIVTGLFAFPFFWLLDTGMPSYVALALTIAFVLSHAAMYGPQGAFLSELFGTRVRYSGASLGTQLASVFAGGLAPLIATWLLSDYGTSAVALYVIGMAVVTVISVLAASETHRHDIEARH